ncbi:uncharacterized protein MELLADRAFT_112195 [Melampsora larici-populina 98AG31]|uniref:Uncharacterized protein n=1 Tax=Melampsora larici-populina (strain 98AG31 / pathotype 3-4-7) TaxID=747676 RepID=F4S5N9_MELLP|nr:uncharacterized protein MELLADRAFT_112195 [Melampsora larici-populina 98AG31]EGG00061.1 hypothetical protein MELLADRAFT_112195 [Melampsora larici-populina 98AG31]
MDFKPSAGSSQQQKNNSHHPYELLNNIPLIKAPGTWLPKPIVLPADLHPMPDDITAYFVYPYTLESSSLNYLSNLKTNAQNLKTQYQSANDYLSKREQLKLIEKQEIQHQLRLNKLQTLHRLAPGWNGQMDSIVSSSSSSTSPTANSNSNHQSNHQSSDLI